MPDSIWVQEEYFKWLYSKIENSREARPEKSFWILAEQMFNKEFRYFVPNDDNRAQDGLDLRYQFIVGDNGWHPSYVDRLGPCSFLEMLIALSERMDFEVEYDESLGSSPGEWFWVLMKNLELDRFTDDEYLERDCRGYVNTVLEVVIERRYSHNGDGGLFPLNNPPDDQRDVEIWYQMSAWLMENTDL